MLIRGACHCGNIGFSLELPDDVASIPARSCGCTFCQKHGGTWTSHPQGKLKVKIGNETAVSRYQFGTKTAEFYICAVCGVPPFVVSEIDGNNYAVVNVNTFEGETPAPLDRASTDFDGEDSGSRLERRKRNWIPLVVFEEKA